LKRVCVCVCVCVCVQLPCFLSHYMPECFFIRFDWDSASPFYYAGLSCLRLGNAKLQGIECRMVSEAKKDGCNSEASSSNNDSSDSDDQPTEVVWAEAAQGVWGMAHIFDRKLYLQETACKAISFPRT